MTFQPNLSIFDFEGASVRMELRGDEPWFVLNDVCAVLEIAQGRSSARHLDDDEKGVHTMHTPGGPQEVTIINESGLYSMILRSRKPVARRFKKWVTAEVLPTLRRTGVYAMVETQPQPEGNETELFGLSLARVNAAARLIACAKAIYGPKAARRLWESEPDLPRLNDLAIENLTGTAEDDPVGCFRHLMRAAAGSGQSIKDLMLLALSDRIAAGRLKRLGIAIDPRSANGYVAIACEHAFLAGVFAETQWIGDWRIALAQLPGARPTRNAMSFGGSTARAVLVPRSEIMAMLYG